MDFLKLVLFESPTWLGAVCFCLFAIVLLLRPRMTEYARARCFPALIAVILGLILLQWLVVTDREKILTQLDAFVAGVEAENRAAIAEVIDEKYDAEGMDREGFLEFLTDSLERVDIFDTRLRRRDITVDGDYADLDLGAVATVRIRAGAGDMHTGRWRLRWRHTDDWRIVSLMPVEIDTIKFTTLQQVRGQIP